jgi:glycosyltransferase involved in cell wall biosynthesis
MADEVKEFKTLNKNTPSIGLLMMVKNEEKRILTSLESIKNTVDALIIYDTGSQDKTLDLIREFSETNKINLYLKKGDFVNFEISRNISLDFADTIDVHYLLLLDCNDELKGGNMLKIFATSMLDKENSGFMICQQWYSGQLDSYFNLRFIRARCGWRYVGSVHEWLKDTMSKTETPRFAVIRLPEEISLFQDRTKDDDKSQKRFTRDRELLLKDHEKNPLDARTLFYLAQTCQCLSLFDEAFYYSSRRLEVQGFVEERFHSLMRCGNCALVLGHEWHDCMKFYVRAYEEFKRAEPLLKIAEYYRIVAQKMSNDKKDVRNVWRTAFMYIREACELTYPKECLLFVDKGVYDYYRWHSMGIIAYYVGENELGKQACYKAIEQGINKEMNEKNLKFYLDAEKTDDTKKNPKTKNEFYKQKTTELTAKFPKDPEKTIRKKVDLLWKSQK